MAYDLVIKNGTVIDGSGMPRFRADVGVSGGRIATIGRIRESAQQTIDAEGHVVTPGVVDGHTHMDAQIFWDPLGTSSCYHGITTVVMGNCGFTLAPCAEKDKHLVVRNLQRAEDISPAAMDAGIKWSWTTYPEYLDAVEALPKGINYAGYVGHSAIRTFVMGERAFDGPATEDDLKAMEQHVRDAIRAGAIGFTTSRSPTHETPDGCPVASRLATWEEVRRLVGAMGDRAPASSNRGRRRGPEGRRPGRARVSCAAARSRGGVRPADHVRRVQPPRRARHLEALPRLSTRPRPRADACSRRCTPGRSRRWCHSRHTRRSTTCRCGRTSASCRSRNRSRSCAIRRCDALIENSGERDGASRSAQKRSWPTTTGCWCSTPWKGRIARWREVGASAESIRSRP